MIVSENYTPEAKLVLVVANSLARQPNSAEINTEHLLLGLERENLTFINRFLTDKIAEENVRNEIIKITSTPIDPFSPIEKDFTSAAERVLAFAAEEARMASQEKIGIDHLLLGLMREEGCPATQMLRARGADLQRIRHELSVNPHQPPPQQERVQRHISEILAILARSKRRSPEEIEKARKQIPLPSYTAPARRMVFTANYEAVQLDSAAVETEHLLMALLKWKLFVPTASSSEEILRQLQERIVSEKRPAPINPTLVPFKTPLSEECHRVLKHAEEEATQLGSEEVVPEHLLLGVLKEESSYAASVLRENGADPDLIREKLSS